MVRKRYLFIGMLVAILGSLIAVAVFSSEERKIRKQFRLLSEGVSKSPEENSFVLLQKMRTLGGLFDELCEFKTDYPSLSGGYTREEISTYVGSARSHVSRLDLTFYDLQIAFPEKEVAKVTLTARLTGRSTTGEQMDEIRELECRLKKIKKKWLFSEIGVVEVLKK